MSCRSVVLILTVLLMEMSALPPASGAPTASPDDAKAQRFISDHVSRVRPLERAAALAWWNANVTGKDEDFAAKEEAQNKLDAALADPQRFSELKALKMGQIDDPVVKRQLEVLYLAYLEKQVDPQLLRKISAKANAVEKAFNAYRATVDHREMTDSEVRRVLKESNDLP